jgi:regulator of replication initiation timing
MHIELLWVIPIISFAVFLFIVAYQSQKSAERRFRTSILSKEVALYNAGHEPPHLAAIERNDERLRELEKTMNLLIDVVGHPRKPVPESDTSNTPESDSAAASSNEVNELKEKLRTVFKEYDILLSENYTLRAKVKQLSKQKKDAVTRDESSESNQPASTGGAPADVPEQSKSSLHLYDDTRLINLSKLEAENPSHQE